MRRMVMVTLLAAVLLPWGAPARAADPPQALAGDPGGRYTVGPGDELLVEVYEEPDASGTFAIEHDGAIRHPLLGRVHVADQDVESVADELAAELGARFLRDPRVTVDVTRYGSKKIKVYGAVRTSEVWLREDETKLDEVLAAAGIEPETATEVWVRRPDTGDEWSVALDALLATGAGNIGVRANDVITVPEGMVVYVDGEVNKPSAVPFRQGLTVTQALTKAGGPTEFARLRGAYLLRDGVKVRVNLKRVLNGRERDLTLMQGDQVVVPASAF
jgi:polysaccharide export outer membrane protein